MPFSPSTGSLTRNSSTDLTDFRSRSDKRKVFDAMAAASIYHNSAGVDTSRARVITLAALADFLGEYQKEDPSEAKNIIEVCGL